jgi:hypothetical protein
MERVESRHRNMDIHVAYAIYSTVYSLVNPTIKHL